MISRKASRGFTLLELMIVLMLVSILSSLIAPLITVSSAKNELSSQADIMRFEFQQLNSRSWIESTSFQVVSNNAGEWHLYRFLDDKWQMGEVLFVMKEGIQAESYSKELNSYSGKLANGKVVFFSSGEYTPTVITLMKDNSSLSIEGDGLNEFVIQ